MRIATRRSALALAQARSVADALGGAELVEVVTAGDRGVADADKSRWVAELERAVLDGEADVAVHSAKDVPSELAPGLAIVAVPARGDARDVLCGAGSLQELAPGSRIGTSSLRRRSQLLAVRPDVDVVNMRGNVDTRLRKLGDGEVDALVLALAGLQRLGRAEDAGATLDVESFVPAPGQGALAVEARGDDEEVAIAVARLDDPIASACLRAERALCQVLGATCRTPIGAHAVASPAGLELSAFVGALDGSAWVRDRARVPIEQPEQLGREVAERVLAAGGAQLLASAEAAG